MKKRALDYVTPAKAGVQRLDSRLRRADRAVPSDRAPDRRLAKRRGNDKILSFLLVMVLSFFGTPGLLFAQPQLSDLTDVIDFAAGELSSRDIRMVDNTSRVLSFERPVVRTAIGDAAVADVVAIDQKEIMIVANTVGNTSLVVWEAGGMNQTFQVFVERDQHVLEDLIKIRFPGIHVKVQPLGETFAIAGEVNNSEERKEVMEVAERYAAGAVDMMTLKSPKQILIDVFFIELDRTNSEDYGYSWQSISKYINLASFAGNVAGQSFKDTKSSAAKGAFTTDTIAIDPSATFPTLSYIDGQTNLLSTLEFLESKNFLRVIAKPKLLAKDGEEAKFLVGGRFPYATVSNGATSVQFEEFGHELTFKPEMLENDIIRLTVEVVVSELNFASTLTISGSTVPSIIENNAKTVVELRDKQTLVIGGFISKRTNSATTSVPILGQIPILGKLFQSEDSDDREHELVFIITPHVISPLELDSAKKAGDFYDAEKVERVLRAEELPDENYQADAIRGALRNYEMNRVLASQKASEEATETITPASITIPTPVIPAQAGIQEAGPPHPRSRQNEETNSNDSKGTDRKSMLNKGSFELNQAIENVSSDLGSPVFPTVRGAAFESVSTATPKPFLGPSEMLEHEESYHGRLMEFQTSMKNQMVANANSAVQVLPEIPQEDQGDYEFASDEVKETVVSPAAHVLETAPDQSFVIPAPTTPHGGSATQFDLEQAASDMAADYATERHYKELASYSSTLYDAAVRRSQSVSSREDFSSRQYRSIRPAVQNSVPDDSIMSSENITRFNMGTRNFRMSQESLNADEQKNFHREQEHIDRFFDELDAKKTV